MGGKENLIKSIFGWMFEHLDTLLIILVVLFVFKGPIKKLIIGNITEPFKKYLKVDNPNKPIVIKGEVYADVGAKEIKKSAAIDAIPELKDEIESGDVRIVKVPIPRSIPPLGFYSIPSVLIPIDREERLLKNPDGTYRATVHYKNKMVRELGFFPGLTAGISFSGQADAGLSVGFLRVWRIQANAILMTKSFGLGLGYGLVRNTSVGLALGGDYGIPSFKRPIGLVSINF